jgi:3-methyl-2-oxobutanoate hydroxymethyltransferase
MPLSQRRNRTTVHARMAVFSGTNPMTDTPPTARKQVTLRRLHDMSHAGEKITMLTCYDAGFARILDDAGVDVLLVGDSLGMVVQGHATTLPVSIQEMEYHTSCVARGNRTSWVIGDMPFGSYHQSVEQAVRNASRLMQNGAHMVKVEGGWTVPIVRALVERGIPVCAHLGFTPQSVHALGGYRIQGRDESAANVLKQHALDLADAGAAMLVLELMPSAVAQELTASLAIPVIGIGAGVGCSGQVLVLYDALGITRGKQPRFVRNFTEHGLDIEAAVRLYVAEVKAGRFPDEKLHGY